MRNGNGHWCVCVVVAYVALLSTTMADDSDDESSTNSPQRIAHCYSLISIPVQCPEEQFPLVSLIQPDNIRQNASEYMRQMLSSAAQLGVEHTCEEFRSYLGCLIKMTDDAIKECADDMGHQYKFQADFVQFVSRPFLETGVKLCDSQFDELNDHVNCFNDFDLLTSVADDCVSKNDDEVDDQCLDDKLSKSEDCGEDAKDLLKVSLETLTVEFKESTDWLDRHIA